jgi:hypothetical protein
VVLGSGKRLFADGTVPTGLELVDTTTTTTGAIVGTHRPTGPLTYGTYRLDAS